MERRCGEISYENNTASDNDPYPVPAAVHFGGYGLRGYGYTAILGSNGYITYDCSRCSSTTGISFTNSSVEVGKQYYCEVKAIHSHSACSSAVAIKI